MFGTIPSVNAGGSNPEEPPEVAVSDIIQMAAQSLDQAATIIRQAAYETSPEVRAIHKEVSDFHIRASRDYLAAALNIDLTRDD
jgi:hypothetical protein